MVKDEKALVQYKGKPVTDDWVNGFFMRTNWATLVVLTVALAIGIVKLFG